MIDENRNQDKEKSVKLKSFSFSTNSNSSKLSLFKFTNEIEDITGIISVYGDNTCVVFKTSNRSYLIQY